MNRRHFVAILGGAAVIRPLGVWAQQPHRSVPMVGALWIGEPSSPITVALRDAFRQGLREDGYIEGQNITIEHRHEGNADEISNAASEFVGLRVDVIVVVGTQATLGVSRATGSIPIVGVNMADPVADGLVASLSRPGGNVTGNTLMGPEPSAKRLQLLRELVPGVTRIVGLQRPGVYSERTMQKLRAEMRQSAKESEVEFQVFDATGPNDFDAVFEAMVNARAEALIVFPSPMFYVNYRRLIELAALHHLPTIYIPEEFVRAGGLLSYGPDLADLARRAAKYVAKIVKGAKPGELPIEEPTKFQLAVNLRTAKALGITVPQSILARADEVIE